MSDEVRDVARDSDADDVDHDDVVFDTGRVAAGNDGATPPNALPATAMLKVWPLLPALRLVVELGGVRAASAALGVQAPAVSKALKQLEAIIGEPLFHRVGRSLLPTERAKTLHREVRAAMRQIDSALHADTALRLVVHAALMRRTVRALDGVSVARLQRLSSTADAVAALRSGAADVVVGVGDVVVVDDVDVHACGGVVEVEVGGDAGIYDGDDSASAAIAAAAGFRAWLPEDDAPANVAVHHRRTRPVWVASRQHSSASGIQRLITALRTASSC